MPKKKKAVKAKEDSHQVKLPAAVAAQGEAADAAMNVEDPPAEPASDIIIDNPSDPPADPAPVFTAADPVPDPVKTEPVKTDPLPDDNVNWQHKYDVLQGMFNAKDEDVKSLRQGMENLQTLVNHQAQQLQGFAASPAAPAAPAAPAMQSPAEGIPKIELDSVAGYGDEIVMMAKGFNALVDMNQQLQSQIAGGNGGGDNARMDRIENFVQESATDRYTKHLDTTVPKWREITATPEFTGWLSNVDPMSGYQYKQMMDFAYNNLRAPQVEAILKAFNLQTGISIGTPSAAPPVQTVGGTNIVDQTIDPLAGQAMPNTTVAGDTGKAPETYPTAEELTKASALYAQKRISLDDFNKISNRFQQGLLAAKQASGTP